MNKKIIDIIDVMYFTLYFAAQNLLRISAAAPISFLFFYIAMTGNKSTPAIPTLTPIQTMLTAIKCSAPLTLIFLPLYDSEKRRQQHEHLTIIGLISYISAWILCMLTMILLPSKI